MTAADIEETSEAGDGPATRRSMIESFMGTEKTQGV
jgi:hypothetical protein